MVYGSTYGTNRTSLSGSFDPAYATPDGCWNAIEEAIENEQKMFDIVIEHDFLEAAAAVNESADYELQAVNEGFASSIWETVKKAIIKVKNFIKSAVASAKVKLGAFFKRDNAALLEKYENQFNAAPGDMKIAKFRTRKSGSGDYSTKAINDLDAAALDAWNKISGANPESATAEQITKIASDLDMEALLGTGNKDKTSFFEKMRDDNFSSESEENLSSISGHIVSVLRGYSTSMKALTTAETTLNKTIKTYEDSVKVMEQNVKKMEVGAQNKDAYSAQATAAHTIVSKFHRAVGIAVSATTQLIKFDLKQCRKAFIKAASKGAGNAAKNESTLIEAVIDADEYEVDSFFDQYEYQEEYL